MSHASHDGQLYRVAKSEMQTETESKELSNRLNSTPWDVGTHGTDSPLAALLAGFSRPASEPQPAPDPVQALLDAGIRQIVLVVPEPPAEPERGIAWEDWRGFVDFTLAWNRAALATRTSGGRR